LPTVRFIECRVWWLGIPVAAFYTYQLGFSLLLAGARAASESAPRRRQSSAQ